MNNKYISQDISKNNNIKLNRNSSLDSTKSSLRLKKIKLHNEFTPFTKITQNTNNKNMLDFPICLSLFANNYSLSEKDQKINIKNKVNFKYPNLKNVNVLKNTKSNELYLPKAKRIISRNTNDFFVHSFSPMNSIIKSSILNNNKYSLQLSKSISKPNFKKLHYSSLTNKPNNGNKILKKVNYYKNNNLSNSTLEQEISAIKSTKNMSTIGDLNFNIIENKKLQLPLYFFTPKNNSSNGSKNDTLIFSSNRIINKINKLKKQAINEEKKNINLKDNLTNNSVINNLINLENINEVNEVNKKILNKKKNNNNSNKTNINNINKLKINKSTENIDEKNKKDFKKIKKNFKKYSIKKDNLYIPTIIKENKINENKINENKINENKINDNNNIFPKDIKKKQNTKFYLIFNNKKAIAFYKKNNLLNEFNQTISEKSINNSINTGIFLQKTQMLINIKDSINEVIIKSENKLKSHETSFLLSKEKGIYLQNLKNKKEKKEYLNISLYKIKLNYKINRFLCFPIREYIFTNIHFEELSLEAPTKKNIRRVSFMPKLKVQNRITSLKRQNTMSSKKKVNFNELDDIFVIQKSKNNFKKDLKWKNNRFNLISIHNYILKSLPYYNDYFNVIKVNNNKNNISVNKNKNKKNHLYLRKYSRKLSKKLIEINSLVNSSKLLLQHIHKKKSLRNVNENEFSKKKMTFRRRNSAIFNFEDFTKSLKRELSHKSSDLSEDKFSVLQRKNFFKKSINIKDNKKDTIREAKIREQKELIKNNYENNKEKEDMDDELFYVEIYFVLIKLIIEGKNKAFAKFFEKNKNFIDVNQELFDKNTLLILCAKEGNYYITKFLCEQGAEVNLQNNSGNTALHYALGKQFYCIADILTRNGAREDIRNLKGLTPWDCIENNID